MQHTKWSKYADTVGVFITYAPPLKERKLRKESHFSNVAESESKYNVSQSKTA